MGDGTGGAFGGAGGAGVAAVQNQPVVGIALEGFRDAAQEVGAHGLWCGAAAEAEAAGDAEDVGIHRDAGVAEGFVEHDIRRFLADPGQGLQAYARAGHLPAVQADELLRQGQHVFGFGAKEADGLEGFG